MSAAPVELPRRVLVLDNFDSFTYNLVEYVTEVAGANGAGGNRASAADAGAEENVADADATGTGAGVDDTGAGVAGAGTRIEVLRNTASLAAVRAADPDAIVVSPGPGHPANERDVGVTTAVLREVSPEVPTLGVCLGLEAAVYAYGGEVGRAPEPIHGKASPVTHDGEGVFAGIEQGFRAGRYHSLIATEVPDCFAVTATTDHDGERLVMGVRHREHPIVGVQFHPESVLTAAGHDLVGNFLAMAVGPDR